MNRLTAASLIALAAAAQPLPTLAQAAPGGFRLPTPTPTPTDIQGPVDPDAPILTRPRDVTETPAPRPAPAPTPTPTPARPAASPTPRPILPPSSSLPPRFTPPAAPTPEESAAVSSGDTAFPAAPTTGQELPPAAFPTAPVGGETAPTESGGFNWLYALGGLAALGLVAGGAAFLRRRRRGDELAPAIAPPRATAPPAPPPVAEPPLAASAAPLVIEARAIRLARSMLNATLSYELHVTNRGGVPLENVRVGADLVTAHARIPTEQQLADPALPLAPVKELARLDPGEHVEFSGELRLPVAEIRPIPHGKAVVYVPLLRVKAEAGGVQPVARTFVVGLVPPGPTRRLQPFRLDELPQTYHAVGQRALD